MIMKAPTAAVLILALVAPPQGKMSQHKVVHGEIDGVPLVRTTGGPKYQEPLFEMESDLLLGIDEGEPEWQMFSVRPTGIVAPDGTMILKDGRRLEFYVISPDGELLLRKGRSGSGPEEFREIWRLHWARYGEEFWVEDRMLSRITCYLVDGKYLGSFNYASMGSGQWLNPYSIGDYRFLGDRRARAGNPGFIQYYFIDSTLAIEREFLAMENTNWILTETGGQGIPYTAESEIMPTPYGRLLAYYPDEGRLTVYSSSGEPILHVEKEWERERLKAEDKEKLRTAYRRSSNPQQQEMADKIPFPARLPPFYRAHLDDRGRIWAEHTVGPFGPYGPPSLTSEHYVFDVFGPDGVWLGVHEMDVRPLLFQGDYVYTSYESESGAPRFERIYLRPLVPEAAGKVTHERRERR